MEESKWDKEARARQLEAVAAIALLAASVAAPKGASAADVEGRADRFYAWIQGRARR